ncbi:MAG: DJ-1/PfpI family protein [Polyangia bacterium]
MEQPSASAAEPRHVGIVLYPGVELLDVTGPLSVLHGACSRLGRPAYTFRFLAAAGAGQPVRSSSGLALVATHRLSGARALDTLLVPGGEGTRACYGDDVFIAALRRLAARARRVVSVCTGSFLLARAGLLSGRACTTHWAFCDELQRLHRDARVLPDPIFVRDGRIWCSAGVTAGLDLALALVEADHGRELAVEVARWMVFYLRRPGGQQQFSLPLQADAAVSDELAGLLAAVREHPERPWPVAELARRLHLGERQLSRLFAQRLRMSPAAYVERARIEAAQQLLTSSGWPLKRIAARSGYRNIETFIRSFQRVTGVTPARFRERFTPGPDPDSEKEPET